MIKRLILNELEREINEPEVTVLLGPRQVGKTTLLLELEKRSRAAGLSTVFYDLEQPKTLAEMNISDAELVRKLSGTAQVVFIDEFQYLKNASKIFKAIYDLRKNIKIFASGSSAIEIHKHLKESLAGRRILYHIFPLSYSEISSSIPENSLDDYIRYGGMPGIFHTPADERRRLILSELLNAFILKDIKSLIKEENIRAFNHLLYLLAQNQGSVVSMHSLSGEVGLSAKALTRYLDIMEQTFTAFRVASYSNNLGNELKKSHKVYLYDLGVRNALLRDFSRVSERSDGGAMMETLVFLKLKREMKPDHEVRFWRTKAGDEVDFILLRDRQPIPIEVKTSLKKLEIPKGLRLFLSRYPRVSKAVVVNRSQTGFVQMDHSQKVIFMTFEEFDRTPLLERLERE